MLVVGQGAERAGERRRASVVASTLEAVVAAVYLDQGLETVRELILRLVGAELRATSSPSALKSPKSRLQERCYAEGGRPPTYRVVSVTGPDHARQYVVEVLVDGDAEGYLLQIFTRNLIGPIFIEIIQRKNHLSFGEGNFGALFRSIERDQARRGVFEEAKG